MTTIDEKKEALRNMTKLAIDRRKHMKYMKHPYWSDINGPKRYIRLNTGGFRLVSLDENNPCGSMYNDSGKINGRTVISKAYSDLESKNLKTIAPVNDKPEQNLQAYIIYKSLFSVESTKIPMLLGVEDQFDALMFVDDEFVVEQYEKDKKRIRADMILLGKKGEDYFPVFVELKAARDASDLCDQLNKVCELTSDCSDEFLEYLSAVTKVSINKIYYNKLRRIAIWPKGGDGKLSSNALSDAGDIIIIGYTGDNYNDYKFEVEKYN